MSAAALLLSDDLIDTSRITAAGRDQDVTVRPVRTADALDSLVREDVPRLVLVDLANPGLSITDLIRRVRAAGAAMPRVVAYGPHVNAAGLRTAREAGCDVVLPRSAFFEQLPTKLADWAA